MIIKKSLKTRPVTKVVFELEGIEAERVAVIGEFSDWQPIDLSRSKSGKWKVETEVQPGKAYEFRYVAWANGQPNFFNDEAADALVPNSFGSQNAVLNA